MPAEEPGYPRDEYALLRHSLPSDPFRVRIIGGAAQHISAVLIPGDLDARDDDRIAPPRFERIPNLEEPSQ